jgi:CRISPR-associated protein Cas1
MTQTTATPARAHLEPAKPAAAPLSLTAVQPIETLIVEDFGAFVGRHSERLRVTVKGEVKAEAPLIYLRQVLIKGKGASLSSDAVLACAERGIAIHFVSARAGASLYTDGLTGTVQTRRAQLLAYQDQRAVTLAIAFAKAKINNQAALLKYHSKSRKGSEPALSQELQVILHEVLDHDAELDEFAGRWLSPSVAATTPPIDAMRNGLMSIEGRAARRYWAGVKLLLPESLRWPGRTGRGARDPFNSALNYGYAILARMVEQAVVLAGLDPFAGFVHADRPGKPSLTLDLIEEYRQPVVDRTLLGMLGKGMTLAVRDDGMLDDDTRREIAGRIVARMEESAERYEGKRRPLREILQCQARHIATFLRGDRPAYQGFIVT